MVKSSPKAHNFHVFRQNDGLKMQRLFAFVDTETKSTYSGNKRFQTFKIGSAIFWNRPDNKLEELVFDDRRTFWNRLFSSFNEHERHMIVYAHNMSFDFRILDGTTVLEKEGWTLEKFYVKDKVFMLEYTKGQNRICFWDTGNYVNVSLRKMAEDMGLAYPQKMSIDFDNCTVEELKEYCLNDTRIIFHFIKNLTDWLEKYQLTRLMPTAGSLAFNAFRHKFYSRKKRPIYIHDWKKAIRLERESYSGGITDCLRIGHINETVYKLDINSMYPSIMVSERVPCKLLWCSSNKMESEKLRTIYDSFKKDFLLIAKCRVRIPSKYAYVLTNDVIDGEKKAVLACGEMIVTKCSPELDFIEKHGRIEEFIDLAIYEGNVLFKDYTEFFYQQRLNAKAENNGAQQQLCKLMLNSLYGKWGQKDSFKHEVEENSFMASVAHNIMENEGEIGEVFNCETGKWSNFIPIGSKLFEVESTEKNSKDSFVAIASFITSYARLKLAEYILQAGRENVFYMDTDSLFVNKAGYERLLSVIDPNKLGYLKVEDSSDNVIINGPKNYQFGDERKLKGVRRGSKPKETTDFYEVYEQERWEGFISALRNNRKDTVMVETYDKKVNLAYNKGRVDAKGLVHPYKRRVKKDEPIKKKDGKRPRSG